MWPLWEYSLWRVFKEHCCRFKKAENSSTLLPWKGEGLLSLPLNLAWLVSVWLVAYDRNDTLSIWTPYLRGQAAFTLFSWTEMSCQLPWRDYMEGPKSTWRGRGAQLIPTLQLFLPRFQAREWRAWDLLRLKGPRYQAQVIPVDSKWAELLSRTLPNSRSPESWDIVKTVFIVLLSSGGGFYTATVNHIIQYFLLIGF